MRVDPLWGRGGRKPVSPRQSTPPPSFLPPPLAPPTASHGGHTQRCASSSQARRASERGRQPAVGGRNRVAASSLGRPPLAPPPPPLHPPPPRSPRHDTHRPALLPPSCIPWRSSRLPHSPHTAGVPTPAPVPAAVTSRRDGGVPPSGRSGIHTEGGEQGEGGGRVAAAAPTLPPQPRAPAAYHQQQHIIRTARPAAASVSRRDRSHQRATPPVTPSRGVAAACNPPAA